MFDDTHCIMIEDENGEELQYTVDSYFEMNGRHYALLSSDSETRLMRVEAHSHERILTIPSDEEVKQIMTAYDTAIETSE